MMHFKNHNNNQPGQTFIEIMLAIFMIGSLLSAVLVMQSTIFSRVTTSVARMQRMFILRQQLFETDLDKKLKKKITTKKMVEKPPTTIIYKESAVPEKSTLHGFKNTAISTLEASWDQPFGAQKETLVALRYGQQRKKP